MVQKIFIYKPLYYNYSDYANNSLKAIQNGEKYDSSYIKYDWIISVAHQSPYIYLYNYKSSIISKSM